jgi:hypothetical protein
LRPEVSIQSSRFSMSALVSDWSSFASVAAVIPLRSLIGNLDPTACKLHCAAWNGEEYPLDVLAFVERLGRVELVARRAR